MIVMGKGANVGQIDIDRVGPGPSAGWNQCKMKSKNKTVGGV